MDQSPALLPFDRIIADLRMILRGLLGALGAWRVETLIALVLYRRISGTFGRIERMLVRFRAGRLWAMPQREASPGQLARGRHDVVMPRRFGWLVQAGGHQAAAFGSQLQAVLSAPEMVELLAASAQARRILRPLCGALAVELPGMVAAPRQSATEGTGIRLYKRRPRLKPEAFRIPLPRGVIMAARRQGFGKDI